MRDLSPWEQNQLTTAAEARYDRWRKKGMSHEDAFAAALAFDANQRAERTRTFGHDTGAAPHRRSQWDA